MEQQADRGQSTIEVGVHSLNASGVSQRLDCVAVEEPMEIRVQTGSAEQRRARSVSVTMRTPGHDFELALGFLFGEGLVQHIDQVDGVAFCGPPAPGKEQSNIVRVELNQEVELDLVKLQRNFYSTSSCGICGKASLEALNFEGYESLSLDQPRLRAAVAHTLPDVLRARQRVFDLTGGLHAAGLFEADGTLLASREDVGRHNAVDKLIGAQLLARGLPLSDKVLVVSGRVSFEILQKALAAGIPMILAVGAPSSLAIEMAQRFGMTLAGFVREGRFNIYAGEARIVR